MELAYLPTLEIIGVVFIGKGRHIYTYMIHGVPGFETPGDP